MESVSYKIALKKIDVKYWNSINAGNSRYFVGQNYNDVMDNLFQDGFINATDSSDINVNENFKVPHHKGDINVVLYFINRNGKRTLVQIHK